MRPDEIDEAAGFLGPTLPANLGPITVQEMLEVMKTLRRNEASGVDKIPAGFWQAAVQKEPEVGLLLTEFLNSCWTKKEVRQKWHMARVAAIFKNGADDQPENYRPISLLCVVYKIFTAI